MASSSAGASGPLRMRYTYIILLTSRDRREDRLTGLRAGADDFLTKPPDPDELAVRLEIAERILKVHDQLARQNEQLVELATVDELTGTKNRRRFREDLELLFGQADRLASPLSLIMFDIDHFKQYNDSFGHPAGDEVLRWSGSILRTEVRAHDVVARYGGEEFVVLLPAAEAVEAIEVAERLRSAIACRPWPHCEMTASLGVATAGPATADAAALVDQADQALYYSKQSGRNQVNHFRDCAAARRQPSETPAIAEAAHRHVDRSPAMRIPAQALPPFVGPVVRYDTGRSQARSTDLVSRGNSYGTRPCACLRLAFRYLHGHAVLDGSYRRRASDAPTEPRCDSRSSSASGRLAKLADCNSPDAPPRSGRLLVILGKPGAGEPRLSVGQTGKDAPPILGRDVVDFVPGAVAVLDDRSAIFPIDSLSRLRPGTYSVQALLHMNPDLNFANAPETCTAP